MKKIILILIITILFSSLMGICNIELIFNDTNTIIGILLSLLGLCLTSYTFILIPIKNIRNSSSKNKTDLVLYLLNEYKENMLSIFYFSIALIIIDLLYKFNIPILHDPSNIDFGLFRIVSLKLFIKIVLEDILCILSFYSFHDIMKSIFILVKSSIIVDD